MEPGAMTSAPLPSLSVRMSATAAWDPVGALRDLAAGARLYSLWLRLGWLDVRLKYRRTYLGPFWVTASFGLSAVAMTIVFGKLFAIPTQQFIPYLISGLAIWTLLSSLILDGCSSYIGSMGLILQFRLPLSVHVYRQLTRNLILFGHNLLVAELASLYFGIDYGWATLLILPALAAIVLNGIWVSILLGTICTRFRDLPPLIALLVNITFFVTPIFWKKEMLAERGFIADFNPLFHFIEILRAPLLGQIPPLQSWYAVTFMTVIGWAATLVIYALYRRRIAYWL